MKYERYRGLASVRLPLEREEMSFVGYEGSRVSSLSSRSPPRQSSVKRRDCNPPSLCGRTIFGVKAIVDSTEREREIVDINVESKGE